MKYFIFIFTLLVAQTTFACSFGPDADLFKTAQENIENQEYKFVLSGTIVEVKEGDQFEKQYVFEIDKAHRGIVDTKQITIDSPGHSCGFFSSEGVHMLVFLRDLKNIDESNPRYVFDTVSEATDTGTTLTQERVMVNSPKACTKEYSPVCGRVEVQCVQAPCLPVDNTYANICLAEEENAEVLYTGPCVLPQSPQEPGEQVIPEEEPSRIENLPTTDPTVGFVEPTTPPPFDNSIEREVPIEESWWQRLWAWITRMLSF